MDNYIKKFSEIGILDIEEVGGKNASLGEMITHLTTKGILVPNGFAVTAAAYKYFLSYNNLEKPLSSLLQQLNRNDFNNLSEIGKSARKIIMSGQLPNDIERAIIDAYGIVFSNSAQAVAVRSSATAEDLPKASFAGQHDSYLNIKGNYALMRAVKQCYASLYTDRAIKYREDKGFDHRKIFLSVGIQEMVRSDIGCSGVGFTLEPESGFKDVIHIAGVWGLGENIVQGTVTPDEFLLFKPTLEKGFSSILQKDLGTKNKMMVYAEDDESSVINIDTPINLQNKFVLEDIEIEKLAKWSLIIERYYQMPMDFEWAKDGIRDQLYIIQARPETVHSNQKVLRLNSYHLKEKGEILVKGEAIGSKIISGPVRYLDAPEEAFKLKQGDILVTDTTSPDWDPILKKVAGIVTNKGGRTSHAAIIARELGVAAVVGTTSATDNIEDGEMITLVCSEGRIGYVYKGKLDWEEISIELSDIKLPIRPRAQLIIADPDKAFELSFYPNHGVGLLRLEFMISNYIKVHPMALLNFEKVIDEKERTQIEDITRGYSDKRSYFIERLSKGVATVAAAFYPKEVIVRMSDFKSNEYAGLIGGRPFEPKEENPMIGFRGASRYYHELYKDGFQLECEAMKVVRNEMGLINVKLMIPFCRTIEEGEKVINIMKKFGLTQGDNDLEILIMAEIPSNILLVKKFAEIFDGFSIGSNDLTQLTLGIDRDSALVADLFDEQNEAVKILIVQMIEKAKALGKNIGLCGQAPSDYESFTRLLVDAEIDSISFNADALLKGIGNINEALLG